MSLAYYRSRCGSPRACWGARHGRMGSAGIFIGLLAVDRDQVAMLGFM
jgi:hypothetical protein